VSILRQIGPQLTAQHRSHGHTFRVPGELFSSHQPP
jgi:hypothetical protein